jgi:hypothetical protein
VNFLYAIAVEEGYPVAHSRSGRNNNPGDIDWGPFAQHHGATRIEQIPPGYNERPRFAYFPDEATGFAAMKALLQLPGVFAPAAVDEQGNITAPRRLLSGYAGATVHECLYRWAPPNDGNDTSAYEAGVCRNVGCRLGDCIDPLVAMGWTAM